MLRLLIDRHPGAACIAILLGFAFAAFYPFDLYPANEVTWIPDADGLRFERGSVLGGAGSSEDSTRPCSIEIWARPARSREGMLAAFHSARWRNRLLIQQYDDPGALRVRKADASGLDEILVHHRFDPRRPTLISIVSDSEQTRVYIDAALADTTSRFRTTMADCISDFVLGSGRRFDSSWDGDLLGLAIYDRPLDAAEIERHRRAWQAGHETDHRRESDGNGAVALYVFDERSGTVVRDRSGGQRNLSIPDTFVVRASSLLARPRWNRIRRSGVDWQDIVINVAGFIPFGFFVCAFAASRGGARLPRLLSSALASACLVSITIEIVQSWIPSRTSSMTDVVTNTLGAAIGALVWLAWRRHSASPSS